MPSPSKSAAQSALEQARHAKPALARAAAALDSADVEALAECRAAGWNPSLGGSNDWFGAAMREPTGASVSWLLSNFPLDAMHAEPFAAPAPENAARWSARAMLVAEDFALGVGDPGRWIAACAASPAVGDYLALSFGAHPRWSDQGDGAPDALRWPQLRALLVPIASSEPHAPAAAKACSKRAASIGRWMAARHPAAGLEWGREVARCALGLMGRGEDVGRMAELLEDLPPDALCVGRSKIALPRLTRRQSGRLDRLDRFGRPPVGPALKAIPPEKLPALGFSALMGPSPSNLRFALDRGWIGPVPVSVEQGCEDPDFIAYDEAQVARKVGRHVDMERRWGKCREIIEASDLPGVEKERLLGRVLARDPARWVPGSPKVFDVLRHKPASPLAFMIGAGGADAAKSAELLRAKAEMLSEAGFEMRSALDAEDPLSEDARAVAGKLAWTPRLIEREEIAAEAGAGAAPARRMAL